MLAAAWYTLSMAKNIALEGLAKLITDIGTRIEKGFGASDKKFAALADDIADIKRDMATKDQVIALHTQINSIETQLRGIKHDKLEARVTTLEEHVLGHHRR